MLRDHHGQFPLRLVSAQQQFRTLRNLAKRMKLLALFR